MPKFDNKIIKRIYVLFLWSVCCISCIMFCGCKTKIDVKDSCFIMMAEYEDLDRELFYSEYGKELLYESIEPSYESLIKLISAISGSKLPDDYEFLMVLDNYQLSKNDDGNFDQFISLVEQKPEIQFNIIMAGYSLDYLNGLSISEYKDYSDSMLSFMSALVHMPNVNIFFYGAEDEIVFCTDRYTDGKRLTKQHMTEIVVDCFCEGKYLVNLGADSNIIRKVINQMDTAVEDYEYELVRRENVDALEGCYISTLPIDGIDVEKLGNNYGKKLSARQIKSDYRMLNTTLTKYIENSSIENYIFFMVLDTFEMYGKDGDIHFPLFVELINANPKVQFNIIMSAYNLEYLYNMSQEDYLEYCDCAYNFMSSIIHCENVNLFYLGAQEEIISNPGNYLNERYLTNEIINRKIIDCFCDHSHKLQNAEDDKEILYLLNYQDGLVMDYEAVFSDFSDLQDKTILFLGDSIFGLYSGSMSIPGVVNGVTNADCYNLGYGGASAAKNVNKPMDINVVVDAVISRDATALDVNSQSFSEMNRFYKSGKSPDYIFVMYGLNDYFDEVPLTNQKGDEYSFKGALTIAIDKLKEAFCDTKIVICTPNPISAFDGGNKKQGNLYLNDYMNALRDLSLELGLPIVDFNNILKGQEINMGYFIPDGTHPSEFGRWYIGCLLGKWLSEQ